MRRFAAILAGVFVILSSAAVLAEPPDIHVDVPDRKGQEVNVVEHDIAPGQSVGWHIHHGVEITYVLSGAIELQISGSPIRYVQTGETFEVGRDVPHRARNSGTTTARLLITYLRDKKGPLKIDVPPPAIR